MFQIGITNYGYIVLGFVLIQQSALMLIYSIGGLGSYIVSYYHKYDQSIILPHSYLLFPLASGLLPLTVPLSSLVQKKTSVEFSVVISAIIILLGHFVIDFFKESFLAGMSGFILYGLGLSFSLYTPIEEVCNYFPERKGLVICFINLMGGLFEAGVIYFGETIINPENDQAKGASYAEEVSNNYFEKFHGKFYPVFSAMIGLYLISSFAFKYFLKRAKQNNKDDQTKNIEMINVTDSSLDSQETKISVEESTKEQKEEGKETEKEAQKEAQKETQRLDMRGILNVLKTKKYWMLFVSSFLFSFLPSLIESTSRAAGAMYDRSQVMLKYLGVLGGLIQAVVGMILGELIDRVQFKKIIISLVVIEGINGILFLLLGLTNNIMFCIGDVINTCIYVSLDSIFLPHIMNVYGIKNSVFLAGIIFYGFGISSICSTVLAFFMSKLVNEKEQGGEVNKIPFQISCLIGVVFIFISFFLFYFEKEEKFNYQKNALESAPESQPEDNLESN